MSAAPGLEPVAVPGRVRPRRRPPLALVPAARPAPRAARSPFVAVVVSLLAAGLLGLLLLHTALAQDAFELHTLKQESRELEDREEALRREVEALRSPSEIARRAAELGMVPAGPPAFLRLSDGTVLGSSTPAEAPAPAEGEAPADDAPADDAPVEDAAADETDAETQADDGEDE